MNFEEFRDLTREEKDKMLFDMISLLSSDPFVDMFQPFVEKALADKKAKIKEHDQHTAGPKEPSIKQFAGLILDYPEVPDDVAKGDIELSNGNTVALLGAMIHDPSHHYRETDVSEEQMDEMLGMLPVMFWQAVVKRKQGLDLSIEQSMLNDYGMAGAPIAGLTMNEKGVLSCEHDHDLHPISVAWYEDDLMLIYPFGMIAFVKKSTTVENPKPVNIYRFD